MKITFRNAKKEDLNNILTVFRDSISAIEEDLYSESQKKAWKSSTQFRDKWINRIKNQHFIIAELEGNCLGFGSIDEKHYLDVLFVDPKKQRQGIASELYTRLESHAINHKAKGITTHASKAALDFFQKQGFKIESEQSVKINDQLLVNYHLSKDL